MSAWDRVKVILALAGQFLPVIAQAISGQSVRIAKVRIQIGKVIVTISGDGPTGDLLIRAEV